MDLLRSCSRQPLIAVLVAAGFVVAACGGGLGGASGSGGSGTSSASSAPAAGAGGHTSAGSPAATSGGTPPSPPATAKYRSARATVIGKSTDVVVNPEASADLKHAGITITAVAPATANAALRFPVSGGQIVVPTLVGTFEHSGGLTFSHSGKSVALTNLVVNTKTKQLTASVSGQSMPIFALKLASPKRPRGLHGTVVVSNIKLTVTPQATAALNSGLGMSTFKAGMNFGVATLTVAYARGHR
jgi:hypothetical protein